MSSRVSLSLALVLLATWYLLAFVVGIQAGAVHLLLGAGAILAVRWWALRPD